uniref:Magnesium transporter protein 1 n=1 Tax=Echinococcus canadensis TaxID=519352 RepID=A0A915ET35_9CEST
MWLYAFLLVNLYQQVVETTGTREVDILGQKVKTIVSLLDQSKLLPLDFEKYNEFLLKAPRNYSVILMLTALSHRHNCHHCQLAADEFAILSRSYFLSKTNENELFFAVADYDGDSEIFTSLNQNTVPVFIHFPPTTSPKKEDVYDITQNGLSAEVLARWVFLRTGIHFDVERPPSYSGLFLLAILASVGGIIFYLRFENIGQFFNRSTISYTCMASTNSTYLQILIFYMISGQVWNSIRRPPAFHSSAEEGLVLFYPNNNSQFVSETLIIMTTYALVSLSFVILTDVNQTSDSNKRRAMAVLGVAMFAVFTSLCLSLFRKKNQSYPYSFLLK